MALLRAVPRGGGAGEKLFAVPPHESNISKKKNQIKV
jgi:hypothetical protein